MNQKNSKIALITGGNRGIGLAIAQGLQAKGYQLSSFSKGTYSNSVILLILYF
jgi:NAD(P)-dependent dehydrogenase (short-subunit alcohol dehydrogenase family)